MAVTLVIGGVIGVTTIHYPPHTIHCPCHLYRYVIRPRVKSYGDSSTSTRSPVRIRMKFLRIFPDTWARTWCLFSSSTRNIAFGSDSSTTPVTSIVSSFATGSPRYEGLRHWSRQIPPTLRHAHGHDPSPSSGATLRGERVRAT